MSRDRHGRNSASLQASKERERDELHRKLHQTEAECTRLLKENRRTLQELEGVQTQLGSMRTERDALMARVDLLAKVQGAVITLYLEMKDRSMENVDQPPDLDAERDELAKVSPLVVLDYLRANLRVLRTFKDDFENELKSDTMRRKTQHEQRIGALESRMQTMADRASQLTSSNIEAMSRMHLAEDARDHAIEETVSIIEGLKKDNERLIRIIGIKDAKISDLEGCISRQKQLVKHQQIGLMKVADLEAQLHTVKMKHHYELQKQATTYTHRVNDLEKEISLFRKIEAENSAYAEELRLARLQIQSYKSDIHRAKMLDSEKKCKRLEQRLASKDQEIARLTGRLRREQRQTNQVQKAAQDITKQVKQQRAEIQKREQLLRQEEKKEKPVDMHEMANENYFHLRVYHQKLREKEKEIDELRNKVRRLMAVEHRTRVMNRVHQEERARFEIETAALKSQLGLTQKQQQAAMGVRTRPSTASGSRAFPSRPASALSMRRRDSDSEDSADSEDRRPGRRSRPQSATAHNAMAVARSAQLEERNEELEEQLRDYHNLKAVSEATAAAYERLLTQTEEGRQILKERETKQKRNSFFDTSSALMTATASPDSTLIQPSEASSFRTWKTRRRSRTPDLGSELATPSVQSAAVPASEPRRAYTPTMTTTTSTLGSPGSAPPRPPSARFGSTRSTLHVGALLRPLSQPR